MTGFRPIRSFARRPTTVGNAQDSGQPTTGMNSPFPDLTSPQMTPSLRATFLI